jgi:hypothetical protein
MSINYNDLLERAKWDSLSDAEIDQVAKEIQKPMPEADTYTLLHILGKSQATRYRRLVERYLESDTDPMLAKLAMQILCSYWDEASHYLDQITRFVQGVAWDEDDDCQLAAVSIAGEYLRTKHDPVLLYLLLELFEREAEDQLIREAAYGALARAMGREYSEIPSAAKEFDLKADIDTSIIERAKSRLSQERLAA